MKKPYLYKTCVALLAVLLSAPCWADWTLVGERSQLNFVTTKANHVAETHGFDRLSSSVNAEGKVTLTIDLTSVNTKIDIRDERMREMLFETAKYPTATLTAQIAPAALAIKAGEQSKVDIAGKLNLHGKTVDVNSTAIVTKLGNGEVSVISAGPILLTANSVGLVEGVEKLREVAGLNTISYSVAITYALTYAE